MLRIADAMSDTPATTNDGVIAALRPHLEDAQIVELVAHLAWEQFRARFNRTLDLPSDELSEGAYCPAPIPD